MAQIEGILRINSQGLHFPSSIYSRCRSCLDRYIALSGALNAASPEIETEVGFQRESSIAVVEDAFLRFKAWAIPIAAFQPGHLPSSLDSRLKEATDIRTRILKILTDLEISLDTALLIVTGVEPNEKWNTGDISDSDEEDKLQPTEDGMDTSELDELFSVIKTTNGSLMKLSVVIRTSPTRDDYLKAASRYNLDTVWDIGHVKEKHGKSKRKQDWLLDRLGKSITRRRQYLKYREEHHMKLAQDWDQIPKGDVGNEEATVAHTKATTFVEIKSAPEQEGSDPGGSFGSQTSYDPTIAGESETLTKLTVPKPPAFAFEGVPFQYGEPFQCPYCYTEQTVKGKKAWKKHVFRDLKPYVCTFRECDLKMFRSRNEWFVHEVQNHRREWVCNSCSKNFNSRSSFQNHLTSAHGSKATGSELEALILQSEEPVDKVPASACMLCDELETSLLGSYQDAKRAFLNNGTATEPYVTLGQFRRHLGRHMEQLALFALPMHNEEGMDDDSAAGSGFDDEEEPQANVSKAVEQLQAESLSSTSDVDADVRRIDDAELETLNTKLSDQKAKLYAWKSVWSIPSLSSSLFNVLDIERNLSIINDTLAEADLAWQSASNSKTPNQKDRGKFKKLVLSLIASVNALHDISTPFGAARAAQLPYIAGGAADRPLASNTEKAEEPGQGTTAAVGIAEEKKIKEPLAEGRVQTKGDIGRDRTSFLSTITAATATTIQAVGRDIQRAPTLSNLSIAVDPIPNIPQNSSMIEQESTSNDNASVEHRQQQQEVRNTGPNSPNSINGHNADIDGYLADPMKSKTCNKCFRSFPSRNELFQHLDTNCYTTASLADGLPSTSQQDSQLPSSSQAPSNDTSQEISDGGTMNGRMRLSRQRMKQKSTREYAAPGTDIFSDTEVDDPEPAPVEESDWIFENREKRRKAKQSATNDHNKYGESDDAKIAMRESTSNPGINAYAIDPNSADAPLRLPVAEKEAGLETDTVEAFLLTTKQDAKGKGVINSEQPNDDPHSDLTATKIPGSQDAASDLNAMTRHRSSDEFTVEEKAILNTFRSRAPPTNQDNRYRGLDSEVVKDSGAVSYDSDEDDVDLRLDRSRGGLPRRSTSFIPPRPPIRQPFNPLPAGWFVATDEKGNTYYYSKSGQTTWQRPTVSAPEDLQNKGNSLSSLIPDKRKVRRVDEDLSPGQVGEEAIKIVYDPSSNFEASAGYATGASTSISGSQSGLNTRTQQSTPLSDFLQRRPTATNSVDVSTNDLSDDDAWLDDDDDDDSDHTTNIPYISPETNKEALRAREGGR